MALEARSSVVAMATKSLSQAQTAALVAAECYRHKLDHMVLTTQRTILWRIIAADSYLKSWELRGPIDETIQKRLAIERQMIDLGGEKCRALAKLRFRFWARLPSASGDASPRQSSRKTSRTVPC